MLLNKISAGKRHISIKQRQRRTLHSCRRIAFIKHTIKNSRHRGRNTRQRGGALQAYSQTFNRPLPVCSCNTHSSNRTAPDTATSASYSRESAKRLRRDTVRSGREKSLSLDTQRLTKSGALFHAVIKQTDRRPCFPEHYCIPILILHYTRKCPPIEPPINNCYMGNVEQG